MIAKVRRRAISWAGVMKKPPTQQGAGGEGKPYLAAGAARAGAFLHQLEVIGDKRSNFGLDQRCDFASAWVG
jgi:hypothetical protein